jgi:hypothetical protein
MQLLDVVIYTLISLVIVFVIMIYIQTIRLIKLGEKKQFILKEHLIKEEKKHQINSGNILLINNLEQSIFNRFFIINREIMLLHKLFYYSN